MSTHTDFNEESRPVHSGRKDPAGRPGPTGRKGVTRLRDLVARRPLAWFFSLTYLLSWIAWTPYLLSENGLGVLHFSFPSALGTTQLLGVLPGAYLGPILSAFLVTAATGGRPALRAWVRRFGQWRVSLRWYLVVLLSVPAALTLALAALAGEGPEMPSAVILAAYVPGLIMQMLTTGLAEEPGWREFAMPRLQRRYGPLAGTLILGPLWGAWHLPLFLSDWGNWPDVTWLMPVEFLATTVAFSFVMTYVFNRTGESLPMAMLLHTGVNNYFSIAGAELFPGLSPERTAHAFLLSATVPAVILLMATRGRLGAPAADEVPPRPTPVA
ncbi:CPBP family intramembrane glutamic endopeptidase [Streptomyces sp. NBC_01187]|uniref:CPBP family intramembrane glutamic endopeptidase n=1 Tax=Streptomyces sp. NBC_01187 TaxID=2903766 RepID=UPI0038643C8E